MRILAALALAATVATTIVTAAWPQDAPGQFDFYVLSLSWSPSFCQSSEDRGSSPAQCRGRRFAFVVHGLWPQAERGPLRACVIPPPRLPRPIMVSMLDLMPAPGLI